MPHRRPADSSWSALLAGAASYVVAELAAGLLIGRFFEAGRAEPLLFFAFRPWLLLAAAALVARLALPRRLAFYALALGLAAASQALLLLALGAPDPWMQVLRGLAAGAVIAALIDLVFQLGRRLGGGIGQTVAVAAVAVLFAMPQGLRPYEAVVLGSADPREASAKPELLLMTALPIIWGEGGAFDAASRPEQSYRLLEREFAVQPLDALDPAALAQARLMLLAQPRALAPEELVALDRWVRDGGRMLVLTDPDLVWPSRWPLGDVRRPPAVGLLTPLLEHWGVRLEAPQREAIVVEQLASDEGSRRVTLLAPGQFRVDGRSCRLVGRRWLARCRVGRGEALLVADADLMRDATWAAPGEQGGGRHLRLSDNPLLVADWLDALAGVERNRAEAPVRWLPANADAVGALLLAAIPLALAIATAAALLIFRRDSSTQLSTG